MYACTQNMYLTLYIIIYRVPGNAWVSSPLPLFKEATFGMFKI